MQAKFVPGGFFFFCQLFQVALGKAPGVGGYPVGGVHATQCVCEMTTERYLAFKRLGFLEQQIDDCVLFF